jgi:hypothetical protein
MTERTLQDEFSTAGEPEEGVWGTAGMSSLFLNSGFGSAGGDRRGGRDEEAKVGTPKGYRDYTTPLQPATPEVGEVVSPEELEKRKHHEEKRVRFAELRKQWERSDSELERLSRRVDEERLEMVELQSQLEEEEPVFPRSSGRVSDFRAPQILPHPPPPPPGSTLGRKQVEMEQELKMLHNLNARLEKELLLASTGSGQGVMHTSKYGRSEPAPLLPFERSLPTRGYMPSAAPILKVKVPMPPQWKGVFNNHGALEEWIYNAAGYLETAAGICRTEALDSVAAKYHVAALFSPVESDGSSAASWARMKLEKVAPGFPYSLDDLFNDMRLFWTDPEFEERELQHLLTMNQGRDTANVYLSKFLQVAGRLRSSILTDHMVHRVFVAGLHPVPKQYVKEQTRLFEDQFLETGIGEAVPSLEKIARWAGARDDRLLAPSRFTLSSVPTPPPVAARALVPQAPSPARPAPKSPAGLPPATASAPARSPSNTKDIWERRAREFQSRFPMEDHKNWPPARDGAPPAHFQCWNCGRTGHWSVACTHARVDPRFASQVASIQIAVVYCDLWEETAGVNYEFEAYGVAVWAPVEEEDLLGLDDSQDFA